LQDGESADAFPDCPSPQLAQKLSTFSSRFPSKEVSTTDDADLHGCSDSEFLSVPISEICGSKSSLFQLKIFLRIVFQRTSQERPTCPAVATAKGIETAVLFLVEKLLGVLVAE
jgi:hypothetical protein